MSQLGDEGNSANCISFNQVPKHPSKTPTIKLCGYKVRVVIIVGATDRTFEDAQTKRTNISQHQTQCIVPHVTLQFKPTWFSLHTLLKDMRWSISVASNYAENNAVEIGTHYTCILLFGVIITSYISHTASAYNIPTQNGGGASQRIKSILFKNQLFLVGSSQRNCIALAFRQVVASSRTQCKNDDQ